LQKALGKSLRAQPTDAYGRRQSGFGFICAKSRYNKKARVFKLGLFLFIQKARSLDLLELNAAFIFANIPTGIEIRFVKIFPIKISKHQAKIIFTNFFEAGPATFQAAGPPRGQAFSPVFIKIYLTKFT
jgi:hypothetical protein